MKTLVKLVVVFFYSLFLSYLLVPSVNFPEPPVDAVQSIEPADSETLFRRAYFTNYTREEVIRHYDQKYKLQFLYKINALPLRLNYPPEEAQSIIRDQTRSTYLEELTYPMRDSIFINGFEPRDPKDDIWYQNKHYLQKITVRFVPSSILNRLIIGVMLGVVTFLMYFQIARESK